MSGGGVGEGGRGAVKERERERERGASEGQGQNGYHGGHHKKARPVWFHPFVFPSLSFWIVLDLIFHPLPTNNNLIYLIIKVFLRKYLWAFTHCQILKIIITNISHLPKYYLLIGSLNVIINHL